jgi:hypothetical protein
VPSISWTLFWVWFSSFELGWVVLIPSRRIACSWQNRLFVWMGGSLFEELWEFFFELRSLNINLTCFTRMMPMIK